MPKSQLTLKELEAALTSYVASNKIANTTFSETFNNLVGLTDKVGLITTIDTDYNDRLPELDGEDLPLGKTVEEYFQDLILPVAQDRDENGTKALKFYAPTSRPVAWSYELGTKTIPESIPNNDIERAVNDSKELISIAAMKNKRIADSRAQWKYGVKRQMIGIAIMKCLDLISGATAYVDATTDVVEGSAYKQGSPAKYTVAVKSHEHAVGDTYASLIAAGVLIELKFIHTVAKPVDTATGEDFILDAKSVAEISADVSEGYSLNGNTIGAAKGLKLYFKQGIDPVLQVKTLAGAFQKEEMTVPVTQKVIKDFGACAADYANKATFDKVYAVMVDPRGLKLHKDYEAMRNQMNGFGDFISLFMHMDYTAFGSRNTFICLFVDE